MTLYNSLTEYDDTIAKVSKPISGLLGISMDGSRVVQHATRNGFVYVRLRDSLSEVVQAYNDKVSPVYDLPVLIERKGNRWYVVGRDTERYSNWGTSAPFLPKHGGQHSFNRDAGTGGDIVPIYPDQFMPALVYPSGTIGAANLIVAPYLLQRNSDFVFVGNTGTQPLTIYKPTNNQARMGLVALNRITGNPEILINSGTSFSASVTGTAGVAPYIPYPSPTQEPLYAFRLVSGTVAITWSNLYNVRQFFRQIQTGSAGGGVSLAFQDEGVPLGTPGTVNFVGDNVSVTVSGTVARVYVTGSSGGGVPTFISGSVPYSGGDGVLKENNPEFKYREDYKQLLLGKEIPLLSSAGNQIKSALVGDQDTTITKALVAFGTGTSGSPSPSFNGYRARGTHDVPLPVKMDDALLNWIGAGFDGGSWINSVRIRAYADGNWITGAHTPSRVEIEITPSGTTTRSLAMTIGSDGNVNIATGKTYNTDGSPHTHTYVTDGWIPYSAVIPTRIASSLDGTFTVTIASPAVVTKAGHGLYLGQKVRLTTTGALPTGLSTGTDYYVIYVDANTFRLATSLANAKAGTAINTSGSQSGTHSIVCNLDPAYRIQFAGVDLSSILQEGMSIKWTQDSIVRYGWICSAPTYSGGNTTFHVLTRCDNTSGDYDVLDTGTYTISNFYYSLPKQPGAGFPALPEYWTMEMTDTGNQLASGSTAATDYNPAGLSLWVTVGTWKVTGNHITWVEFTGTNQRFSVVGKITDGISDIIGIYYFLAVSTSLIANGGYDLSKHVRLTSPRTYHNIVQCGTSSPTALRVRGDISTTRINAVCSYL